MKKRRQAHGIELGFGINAYVSLGMAGFFGLLPLTAGFASVVGWLGGFAPGAGSSYPILSDIVAPLSAFSIVIMPWLVPCLILRARQPKGARIDWTSEEVFECDGPWKRTVIPWDRAEAGLLSWSEPSHRSRKRIAIQIWDTTNPSAVITAWEEEPDDAPIVRRRLEASKLSALDGAIENHVGYKGTFELERAIDPDRIAQTTLVRWLTRLGYVGGFMGPLVAAPNPAIGIAISVASMPLLAWRAAPVFRELVRVGAKLGTRRVQMPVRAEPYRAGAPETTSRDPAEILAWRYRFRAVLAEAGVRGLFVILPLLGAIASILTDVK